MKIEIIYDSTKYIQFMCISYIYIYIYAVEPCYIYNKQVLRSPKIMKSEDSKPY